MSSESAAGYAIIQDDDYEGIRQLKQSLNAMKCNYSGGDEVSRVSARRSPFRAVSTGCISPWNN